MSPPASASMRRFSDCSLALAECFNRISTMLEKRYSFDASTSSSSNFLQTLNRRS